MKSYQFNIPENISKIIMPQNKIYDKDKYKNEKAPNFKSTNPKEAGLKAKVDKIHPNTKRKLSYTLKVEEPKRKDISNKIIRQGFK